MDRHFMKSYMRLLIDTCHRRGAYATGGMAAQIIDSPKRYFILFIISMVSKLEGKT